MAYCTTSDVQSRNPYRTIGASTKPTTAEVQAWIDEAEAYVDGALATAGLTSPCVNTSGIKVLRNKVATFVSGLVKIAYASAGGDDANDDGQKEVQQFNDFLIDLRSNSVEWGGILQSGTAGTSAQKLRSYTTNNTDSKTVANGDFDPEYERGDVF